MSYSPKLSYFLDRLQGFSCNYFKMMPQGSTSAVANSVVRITLPHNSLINLKNFSFHFDAAISSANDQGRLPNKIDSLINRVEITMGGVQVQSGNNDYNVLRHAKDALMGDKTCPLLGHPEVVRAASYHTTDGTAGITSKKEVAASYVINNWEGFLGSAEPAIFDTGLVGDVVVTLYLADNTVCIDASGTALSGSSSSPITVAATSPSPVYALTNMYATVETVGLADGTYDSMVSQIMSSKGYLEIPFKNYISFQDTTTSTMRFSLATQSLDRLWVAFRNANYNTPGGAVAITGYDVSGTAVNDNSIGKILDYNKEKYTSKYFNFPLPTAGMKAQFHMNGALIPQYQASSTDWADITLNSLEHKGVKYGMNTYLANYCVYCLRLNLPDSEKQRLISGLDTKSISLNAFFNMFSNTTERSISIFAETTSTLRIGAGQQLELLA